MENVAGKRFTFALLRIGAGGGVKDTPAVV